MLAPRALAFALVGLAAHGCARAPYVNTARLRDPYPATPAEVAAESRTASAVPGLEALVVEVAREHPALRAAHARWRAAALRVRGSQNVPALQLSYAVFLSSVETRVGPQRQRLSLRQAIPWPAELTGPRDAARAGTEAAARRFDSLLLSLRAEVAGLYWELVRAEAELALLDAHDALLATLEESARVGREVGRGSPSELYAFAIARTELADRRESWRTQAEALRMELAAMARVDELAIELATPRARRPTRTAAELALAVDAHPELRALALQGEAARARARTERAARWPRLSLGLDWIETGPLAPGGTPVDGSGRDPVALGLGLTVPWSAGAARARAEAAEAEAEAEAAGAEARSIELRRLLTRVHRRVLESARQIALVEGALLPQVRAAQEAELGALTSGSGELARVLAWQRRALELEERVLALRAEHARAWAELEALVGAPIRGEPIAAGGDEGELGASPGAPLSHEDDAGSGGEVAPDARGPHDARDGLDE